MVALLNSFKTWLQSLFTKQPHVEVKPMQNIEPTIEPANQQVYEFAKSCLGKDIAKTQNELGCAEAVSYILLQLKCNGFPKAGFLSTTDLYYWMKKYFTQVSEPKAGDIVICPTGMGKSPASHGHVGIVAQHGILSNNSMTGLFDEYYTQEKWKAYYVDKLGFPVIYFNVIL